MYSVAVALAGAPIATARPQIHPVGRNKVPAAVLLTVVLVPWSSEVGVHPGIILLSIVIAMEVWFLPYQQDSYLLIYHSTEGKAFSHAQGRKIMLAKFFASFLAIAISVP